MTAPQQREFIPGITLRSVCACLLAMVLMGIHIQAVEVVLCDGSAEAEQAAGYTPVELALDAIGDRPITLTIGEELHQRLDDHWNSRIPGAAG
ncbi:MAG: hypothetical protein HQ592_15310 [Planctomycetes bacterium]|nr:hypothetical protein [Planctomycetota bacterium]